MQLCLSIGKIIKIKNRILEVKWTFDGYFIYDYKDRVPPLNGGKRKRMSFRRSQRFAVGCLFLKTLKK